MKIRSKEMHVDIGSLSSPPPPTIESQSPVQSPAIPWVAWVNSWIIVEIRHILYVFRVGGPSRRGFLTCEAE